MKSRLLLGLFFAWATLAQAASLDANPSSVPELKPAQAQAQAAHLAAEVLDRYHYKATPLDDAMSEKIFAGYLKSLDREKIFFVQSDIDRFAGMRTQLGRAILKEDLSAPFRIFNLYTRRASERFAYARSLLKQGFDFRPEESYQYDRTKEPWPASEADMRDLWRKRVKNDWLRLKLAGQNDKAIAATLDKRYGHSLKRLSQVKSEDAFQTFMNAYTMALDPHTNYLGPRAAEDFDISMKLSLVGIGASLEEKDDYTTIRELVPGGPAALSGQLEIGDRIVGIAQSEGGAMTDVHGMRLDDTVALIRGAADSPVLLDVLPVGAGPDGKRKSVALIRKKITLVDQSAKKSIVAVTAGNATRSIGVISLPVFYEDFDARKKGNPDFKSASRDVARLLSEMKKEKVDAVLMDLRGNGGGALGEAIALTGLFIGNGPVVQQRDAKGRVAIANSTGAGIVWNGPLGVLIDRRSASASEIFAAAIQDYGRGLVIGEPSFGKGTVQTVMDLDEIANNDKAKFGELKFTIAQFFRVNGGTTQLRGVTPDIRFPTVAETDGLGESSFDNALPWMQIEAAHYLPAGDLKAEEPILLARHEARVKNDKDFRCLEEDIAEFELQRRKKQVSLNEAERRHDRVGRQARLASCAPPTDPGKRADETLQRPKSGRQSAATLDDDGLQANERNLALELANEKAGKSGRDVVLDESVQILGDEAALLESARFAAKMASPPIQR